jgi:predicted O-linked N-acetylglucosamine transferase (SPINDLY family)
VSPEPIALSGAGGGAGYSLVMAADGSGLERAPEREAEARAQLQTQPDSADAWFALGTALHGQERLPEALGAFQRTLELEPGLLQAHNACVVLLTALGRSGEALDHLGAARRLAPGDPVVAFNTGVVLERAAQPQAAIAEYERALSLDPTFAPALMNLGTLLGRLGRHEDALSSNRRLVAAYPDLAEAHFNLAESLLQLFRFEEALGACDRCLALDVRHAKAFVDRGIALSMLRRFADARRAFANASRVDPGVWSSVLEGAASARGAPISGTGQSPGAPDPRTPGAPDPRTPGAPDPRTPGAPDPRTPGAPDPRTPGAPDPRTPGAPDPRAVFLLQAVERLRRCDWADYEALVGGCREVAVGSGQDVVSERFVLFDCWATPVGEEIHRCVVPRVAQALRSHLPPRIWTSPPRADGDRLRIGYLSPDYRQHPTGLAARALFGLHDRDRFEVRAYSLAAGDGSDVRRDLEERADAFVDLSSDDDGTAAWRVFRDGCDVLVDLAGYTRGSRPEVLANRPAPIQVTYLGYEASMGPSMADYHVTSAVTSPPEDARDWPEARVFLPYTHFLYDDQTEVSTAPLGRREVGLPLDGVVYCCFNQPLKIDPETFDAWVQIVREVPGSVMWLRAADAGTEANLRREARARGLEGDRLVFAPPVPDHALHLARLAFADVYLDTFWFNGHTTAADALWAGVPAVTRTGSTPYGRLATSLLTALGLDELAVDSTRAFVELAVQLGSRPDTLASVREQLAAVRPVMPLFDTVARVRALEAAYVEMVRRHRVGVSPGDLVIEPVSLRARPA